MVGLPVFLATEFERQFDPILAQGHLSQAAREPINPRSAEGRPLDAQFALMCDDFVLGIARGVAPKA
jgi:hypothetical protein